MEWMSVPGNVTSSVIPGLWPQQEVLTSLEYAVSAELMTSSLDHRVVSSGMSRPSRCVFSTDHR